MKRLRRLTNGFARRCAAGLQATAIEIGIRYAGLGGRCLRQKDNKKKGVCL